MCGRFTLTRLADLNLTFPWIKPPQYFDPRYNVAPSQSILAARNLPDPGFEALHWGLIPSWAKDRAIGDRLINARGEKLTTSNAFKRAFERRRCIVPADGFYEWQPVEGQRTKQPWFFRRRDGEPLAFAGLWEIWHDRDEGDDAPRVRSCTIITTTPNELVAPIHDRMPVALAEASWSTWLDADKTTPYELFHDGSGFNSLRRR